MIKLLATFIGAWLFITAILIGLIALSVYAFVSAF